MFTNPCFVVDIWGIAVASRAEQLDVRRDELRGVLVRRCEKHLKASGGGL